MDKQFEVNEEKGVAIITLVRQETYNTLTLETLTALKSLLHSMATSNSCLLYTSPSPRD